MDIEIKRDGLTLRGLYEKISDHIVILSHGFSSNYTYYDELSRLLNDSGFSTLRFDFNGHGKSDGEQSDMNVMNECSDLMAVIRYVKSLGYKHIYLIGQSQGGVVTSMVAGYYSDTIEGVVLMAPAAILKEQALEGKMMGFSFDSIPEVMDLGFYKVGGEYYRIARTLPIYETAEQYTGPVLLLHGDADSVVPYRISEHYHSMYKNSELHIIPDEDHNFTVHSQDDYKMIIGFLQKIKVNIGQKY